jgi:prepilin peptidase CpaA
MVDANLVYVVLLVFPALMAFGAAMDLFTMTIPNRVSIALIVGFLIAAVAIGMPLQQFGMHVAVGVCMLLVGMVLFALRIVGGGDAKLLAAASLWVGFEQLGAYMMYVAILGGALALAIVLYRTLMLPGWLARQEWAMRLHRPNMGIPYGIAIGGAGLWMFPATVWFSTVAAGA